MSKDEYKKNRFSYICKVIYTRKNSIAHLKLIGFWLDDLFINKAILEKTEYYFLKQELDLMLYLKSIEERISARPC